jgi:alcohol dehydrogenase class IV
MDMSSFQYISSPLRLFHGPASLENLGRELDRVKSKRAVIVCGPSMARHDALLDHVCGAMGDRYAGLVAQVRAHSPVPAVEAAADALKQMQADAVVAVGGGSAIVTARAASILAAEGRDVRALCTTRDQKGGLMSPKLLAPKLPQFIIPTTPTTAAVKAGSAVFDPVRGERLALFDPKTRAHSVFIDPRMLLSAPRGLLVSAALNTFVTAIEGLMSRIGNPLADAQLMHAVRLLGKHLAEPVGRDDAAVRGEMALAAVLCGQGTDNTGAGMTTVLGHAIGARHAMENGTANAIVLAHVMRFNAEHASTGLAKVAAALSLAPGDALSAVANAVRAIFAALGVPSRLRDAGIPADALAAIAELGMGDWFLSGNPRLVSNPGELQTVLEQAW